MKIPEMRTSTSIHGTVCESRIVMAASDGIA